MKKRDEGKNKRTINKEWNKRNAQQIELVND